MKIILGVDDSSCSEAAVEWIRGMTWPRDTQVVVVSVDQPTVGIYAEVYAPVAPNVALLETETRVHEELAARAEAALSASGIPTTARVTHGDPRVELVEAARAERADLMVVGSHGRTGIRRLILGSVAQYVISHAPCSVVVVKTGCGRARAA